MEINEFNKIISERTGIPEALLDGETMEESISKAKALMAYKEQINPETKTGREAFAEWIHEQAGIDDNEIFLADLEEAARIDAGKYPSVVDAGEAGHASASSRELFAEWIRAQMAFNPLKDPIGWTHLQQ